LKIHVLDFSFLEIVYTTSSWPFPPMLRNNYVRYFVLTLSFLMHAFLISTCTTNSGLLLVQVVVEHKRLYDTM
jgi:hypothetical protein